MGGLGDVPHCGASTTFLVGGGQPSFISQYLTFFPRCSS